MAHGEKPEAVEGVEEEYESDLDDEPLPALRRAAASDDEEEEDDEGTPLRRRRAGSDVDSDEQGAAEVYDEGAYDDGEEYEEYEAYEEFEERGGGGRGSASVEVTTAGQEESKAGDGNAGEADEVAAGEEEKKGSEPYAVPTTGAFYMHDDRLQEARGRGRGRQRRFLNNKKLWNPKEEQAWVHDRFDGMNLHDFRGDNTKRKQGGHFRGRGGEPGGRTRGIRRGSFRGNRSQAYYQDGSKNYRYVAKEHHAYHDNTKNAESASYHDISKNAQHASSDSKKNRVPKLSQAHYDNVNNYDAAPKESRTSYSETKSQKNAPRLVPGRVTKRYQPRQKGNTETSLVQNNESQSKATPSNVNLVQAQTSNSQAEQVIPVKQTVASNLNSASPPFYPSTRSFRQAFQVSQVGSGQPSVTSRPLSSSMGNLFRGNPFVPSVGHVEVPVKGMNSLSLNSSASSPNSPFAAATNQVTRGYVRPSHPIVQPRPVQSSVQSAPRMPAQMFGARFGGSNKMPSSVQPAPSNLSEDTEISSPGGSNKHNTRLSVKGQPGDQGEEHASFLYGGSHGTPALLPVMQFGSQRPGGPGVPSIGMALPGFVSQQQLGLGNSEMTWLPMLTSASGALGGPYGSSYITVGVDGSYYSGPSQQASSSVSLREPGTSKVASPLKSQKMTEDVSDELGQRQTRPRRYSEMNFGQ